MKRGEGHGMVGNGIWEYAEAPSAAAGSASSMRVGRSEGHAAGAREDAEGPHLSQTDVSSLNVSRRADASAAA